MSETPKSPGNWPIADKGIQFVLPEVARKGSLCKTLNHGCEQTLQMAIRQGQANEIRYGVNTTKN